MWVTICFRFWESLSTATCCKSLVVVFGNECLLQIGAAAKSSERDESAVAVDINKLTQGSLYKSCMQSSKSMKYESSYLLNPKLNSRRSSLTVPVSGCSVINTC